MDMEQEIYYTIATQKTTNMGHGMGNRTDYIIEPLPLEGSYGYATSKEYPPLFTNKGEAGIYNEEFHNGLGVIVEMKVQLSKDVNNESFDNNRNNTSSGKSAEDLIDFLGME